MLCGDLFGAQPPGQATDGIKQAAHHEKGRGAFDLVHLARGDAGGHEENADDLADF